MSGRSVLVLDADAKSALPVVRALGRAGDTVAVAGPRPGGGFSRGRHPAQLSRWAARSLTHPDSRREPGAFVAWLDEAIRAHGPDCVLPQTEYSQAVLDRHSDRFRSTVVALPPQRALRTCHNKEALLEVADSLGIAVPRSWCPADADEAAAIAGSLSYPVYVKARESYSTACSRPRFARGCFAHDAEAFLATWGRLDALCERPLAQEAVRGRLLAVSGVWDRGRRVALFCYATLRTWPISGGYSTLRLSIPREEAPVADTDRLMGELEWSGPAHAQYIQDERDGRFRLLEVNGRFWGSTGFAELCGAPITSRTVSVALGEPIGEEPPYRIGELSRWIEGDLKRVHAALFARRQVAREALRVPGRIEALGDLIAGFRPGIHQDDFLPADPVPGFALGWRIAVLATTRRRGDSERAAEPPATDGLDGRAVLLLDAEAKSAPTVVRALGRLGVRVLVAAPLGRITPAQRSRYAAMRLAHPNAIDEPDALVAWLEDRVRDGGVDCVLPETEYTIRVLDRYRDRLAGQVPIAIPSREAIEIAFNKGRLLALADELGLPMPRTFAPASLDEGLELAGGLPFPVFVKPRESYRADTERPRFARGRFAWEPESYRDLYGSLHAVSPLPLVQEAIPGRVVDVDGVWKDGRRGPLFCHRVYRSWPISGGYGVLHRSIAPEEAPVAEADALMQALGWTGPAQVQFIQDERDGRCLLLEINGRFWGFVEFAHYCGVPIAADTVKVAMGGDPSPAEPYPVGPWVRWFEGDIKRLYVALLKRREVEGEVLTMPGRAEAFWDVISGFRPGIHQDDWYADDPMPFLALQLRTLGRGRKGGDAGNPWSR